MTIKELIETLSVYDNNITVPVDGYEGGISDELTMHLCDTVATNVHNEWYYGEHEEYGGNQKRLVIGR